MYIFDNPIEFIPVSEVAKRKNNQIGILYSLGDISERAINYTLDYKQI